MTVIQLHSAETFFPGFTSIYFSMAESILVPPNHDSFLLGNNYEKRKTGNKKGKYCIAFSVPSFVHLPITHSDLGLRRMERQAPPPHPRASQS